jgi:hypothetical protein
MRRTLYWTLLLLPIVHPVLLQAACECPSATPADQLEMATLAFHGTVEDIRLDKKSGQTNILFDVIDSFKGSPDTEVTLTDALAGTDCAMEFKEKRSYLVYAHWEWGTMVTSRCMGTKPLEKATEDAQALGPSDAAKAKYYEKLQALCMGRMDTTCCLASLRAMKRGGYLPEPETGCPERQVPDRLTCAGTFRWCVPVSEPAQIEHTPLKR